MGQRLRGLSTALALALAVGFTARGGTGLREDLQGLAAAEGFTVEGLDWVGDEPAPTASGALPERLRILLQGYNYVLIQGGRSGVEKLRITSRKDSVRPAPRAADRATIRTVRVGAQHQVDALVVGPNGVGKSVALIVDTGASTVVLPESLAAELGFQPERLQDTVSQTASGRVPSKLGLLRSVRVGAVAAADVPVSFIADAKLQGAMLLGMSFLRRFRMTIDDANDELILFER